MSDLDEIVTKITDLTKKISDLTDEKDEARKEFIGAITDKVVDEDSLPTRSIVIPADFFDKVSLTEEEWLLSRFPAWKVTHRKIADDTIVYILTRKPQYVSRVYSNGEREIAKIVTENTPEFDLKTLLEEDPELYDLITETKIVVDVDEAKLNAAIDEDPARAAVIVRHLQVKPPIVKVQPKKEKKNG